MGKPNNINKKTAESYRKPLIYNTDHDRQTDRRTDRHFMIAVLGWNWFRRNTEEPSLGSTRNVLFSITYLFTFYRLHQKIEANGRLERRRWTEN